MYLRVIAVFRLWIANNKKAVVKQLLKLKIRFQIVFLIKRREPQPLHPPLSTILISFKSSDLLFSLVQSIRFYPIN
jgi:hypothetical protein